MTSGMSKQSQVCQRRSVFPVTIPLYEDGDYGSMTAYDARRKFRRAFEDRAKLLGSSKAFETSDHPGKGLRNLKLVDDKLELPYGTSWRLRVNSRAQRVKPVSYRDTTSAHARTEEVPESQVSTMGSKVDRIAEESKGWRNRTSVTDYAEFFYHSLCYMRTDRSLGTCAHTSSPQGRSSRFKDLRTEEILM
ncbi:unnamed protein product [Xylocopa violacea]|uniref:Uncharacterized protein n=1 Tax=Xylocopa violacea TaxID=135666 RepID=A0ABP1NJ80_XYLVO